MMYAQNAVSVNEFLGQSWQKVLPGSTERLGVLILKSRGIFPEAKWYWIGFGALLGFTLIFNSLFTLCLAYLKTQVRVHSLFYLLTSAFLSSIIE